MGRRVLVIEDEASIAEAIGFILARDGWEVARHDRGAGALELIRASRPDLVILDLMLPGRTGLEILRALRAEAETAALPVLMLSARGQLCDRELAASCGASRFMAKPFCNTEMLASVRELVAP
jgi:two-component system OmpR family response regulator